MVSKPLPRQHRMSRRHLFKQPRKSTRTSKMAFMSCRTSRLVLKWVSVNTRQVGAKSRRCKHRKIREGMLLLNVLHAMFLLLLLQCSVRWILVFEYVINVICTSKIVDKDQQVYYQFNVNYSSHSVQ